MKLTKEEQKTLNDLADTHQGLQTTLIVVAKQAGRAERKLWEYANKINKSGEITSIEYGGKNTKLIIKEDT